MEITVFIKGEPLTFVSYWNDKQATTLLKQLVGDGTLNNDFARSLASSKKLSDAQQNWVHKLVADADEPQPEPDMQAPNILAMMNLAAEKLKWPKVDLGSILLKRSGSASKRPGTVWITDGASFDEAITYGHIRTNGDLFWKGSIVESVRQKIEELEQDPSGTAAAYGRREGRCCFCATMIVTNASLAVGYGPICAEHFGLPWGEEK